MKAKFNKLDRSKLSKEVNSILDKIKKATDNFKKEDKKAEALFDRLYDKIKEGKPEAIKSTKKPSKTKKKKSSGGNRGVFVKLAKSIRDAKPSMTWNEALKEASKKLKADKEKANKKFASSIQTIIDANKKYFGSKTASSLEKDAKQPAKPIGKRRSKKGKTYYEYRTNRTDVKQPPKSFPMLEKGGNVDLFDNYETLPKKVRDTIDFYMEKYQDGDYTYEDSKKFLEEMQKQGYTFEYGLDNEPYDLRKMAKGGKVEFITTRYTNKGFGYSSDDYIAKVPYKNKVYIVQMGGLWNDYNLSFEEMLINDDRGNLVDKRIARAVFRKMLKEKPSTPPKPIKEIKFAKGGAIKGRNNKTGESYGVVIGSMKYTDEDKDRVQVDVRSSYSSRISERQLVFDTKGNLIETTNYGYTLDGTLPKRGSGQGKSINASNKKETIDALVDLGYNKGFANKLIDAVKDEEFAKGGKIGFEGLAKKVAKNYEGKKVKPKFQDEYGKTYDKEEAMQVGRAVAGKVLKQQNMKKMEDGGIVREENVAYQGGLNYGTTRTIAPQFGHGGNVNRGSFNVTITMKDGRSADILPIDVSEEDAQDIADMINNMKPMSARADMPLPFEDGGAVTDDYYARGGNVEVGDTILKVNEDDISKVFEMGYEGGIQEYLDDLNNKGLGYAEYDERQQEIYTNSKDILNELENEGIGFKTYGFAKGGKIKIGDVVANTETRTIGVVRDVFEDDGDVRTDADGVVDARNLEHYSKMKHKDYQIAPSTKREIGSKYAKGGKTQGYNARLDESLGNRKGRESTKQQSKKDRRDESKGMEKGSGRRAYSSVSTMDVGDRMMAKGGKVSMSEKLKMVEDEAIKIDPNPRNDKEAERVYKIAYKRVMGEDFEKKEIHKYKFKKGDSFETDTSYNLGGKNDIVTITKLEQDLDMLPSYYIGRYKQKRFSKFDGNLSKEELENLVESGKWKKISFEKGGGIFAKGKEGRYHILGVPKSKPMAKPNFHSSVHNFSDIKEAVEVARKDFKDLTDKDYDIFVTDNKEDRQIYNYEKGGKVKAKKEIVEGLEELEVGLAGASKKHKQQSKLAKQIKDGFESSFEKGGNVPKRFLDEKGERKNDPETIEELTEYVMSLPQTKSKHFNKVTNKYSARRQKLHRKIINEFKDELVCIESDEPIAILMGGSPASGKSTFLRKYAPYLLKEELLRIDADEVRAMLPEYKGWNASATHNETQDIVKTLLSDRTIGIPCKYDVIFDGTMTSPKKYLDLIRLLKKLGYKVFVVFIDKVPKDVIMKRAMDRYKKSGRFVPPFVIEEFFETGKDSLAKVKAKVDGYMIVDGSNNNYKVIEQKGLKLPKTRKYSRLGVPLKRKVVKKK